MKRIPVSSMLLSRRIYRDALLLIWVVLSISICTLVLQLFPSSALVVIPEVLAFPVQQRIMNIQRCRSTDSRQHQVYTTYENFAVMKATSSDNNDNDEKQVTLHEHQIKKNNQSNSKIQFLGKGIDAIVRLGVVLVAPQNEFHHFYRQAAIFIYAMGYDEMMPKNEDGTSTYYIRGVILDHPTPFTIQEMIPTLSPPSSSSSQDQKQHPLGSNLMFRGGDKGRENSVLLLHNQRTLPGCSDEIGNAGIFHGGFDFILSSSTTTSTDTTIDNNNNNDYVDMDSNNFKFFFNYCEFTEDEIEELLTSNEDGDAWASVQIHDPTIILNEEWDRGDCWRYIRNSIIQEQMKES